MGAPSLHQEELGGLSILQFNDSEERETTELYAYLSEERQEEINEKKVYDPIHVTKAQKKWDKKYSHGCFLLSLSEKE